MSKAAAEIENVTESLRQLVIASRNTPTVGPKAEEHLARLNELYEKNPKAFSKEDVRWVNVLRGYLSVRLAAHGPKAVHARKAKIRSGRSDGERLGMLRVRGLARPRSRGFGSNHARPGGNRGQRDRGQDECMCRRSPAEAGSHVQPDQASDHRAILTRHPGRSQP